MPDKKPPAAAGPLPAVLLDFPERKERLECPDLYAGHWVELVTNVPPNQAQGKALPEFLASVIKAWNFKTPDGQPAPITAAAMEALPPDLWNWLLAEYVERRDCPLGKRPNGSPPPTT
jgi:hypothetical protein